MTRIGTRAVVWGLAAVVLVGGFAQAEVGDPQLKTDDPWYPGELSCSSFDRLFKTEAQLYRRVTGREVHSDEDKALAAWYWRNLNYWHGEEGHRDCFSGGFSDHKGREYWTGLFADGFAICGTTHAQWCAEMDALLGHCRSRVVGVSGHNSFEVYLTGGAYGAGRWALLDHDISTVVFDPAGKRLLSLPEVVADVKVLADPSYDPARQHGWRIAGLYDDDAKLVYKKVNSAEYLAGYAGPPPMVHLRSGETLRRYLRPGLDDGNTFVFWGRNYDAGRVTGPQRDRTWVNQPQNMYRSKNGTGAHAGQARFANAVYSYTPDFADGSYRQGVIDEGADHVTFEFYSPYVIATTPPDPKPWGIYDAGGKNGLVIHVSPPPAACDVQVSTDQGKTWQGTAPLADGLDLTDQVKGFRQYFLRLGASASALKDCGLSWRTVCQANACTMPHLHDGQNAVTFEAGGTAIVSAGPLVAQEEAHVVAGKLDSPRVTLELTAPRQARPVHLYAAAQQASGDPPAPVRYAIDYSLDGGNTWKPLVRDWRIDRRPPEPPDFWSQSFTWADAALSGAAGVRQDQSSGGTPVRVRFSDTGGKPFRAAEAHLAYEIDHPTSTEVTFCWQDSAGQTHSATHAYEGSRPGVEDATWRINAGRAPQTLWVQMQSK